MGFDWGEYARITLSVSVGIAVGALFVLAGVHTISLFVGSALGVAFSLIIIWSTKKVTHSRGSEE